MGQQIKFGSVIYDKRVATKTVQWCKTQAVAPDDVGFLASSCCYYYTGQPATPSSMGKLFQLNEILL